MIRRLFADSNIIARSRFAHKQIQNWFSVVSRAGFEKFIVVQRNRMEIVQCTQPLVRKEVSERINEREENVTGLQEKTS